MRFILLIFSMLLLSVSTAQAEIPSKVMEPYKSYRTALENGDKKKQKSAAKTAWQQAEKLMGDHKTTGDLAQNYADALSDIYSDDRRKAYQRSIELAHLYGDNAVEIRLVRQIKLAGMGLFFSKKGGKHFRADVLAATKLIKKSEFVGTIYDGEIKTLNAVKLYKSGSVFRALKQMDIALDIFSKPENDATSIYPYLAQLYRADFLKHDKQKIAALIQYQSVMQNVEGKLASDHPYVKRAFRLWIGLRYELEEDGRLAEAEAAGMCECWPFADYKSKIVPLKRVPPKMPSNARRSGHVILNFVVTDEGKVSNVKVISSTQKLFEKPSLNSVKKWIYSPKTEEEASGARNGVTTKITFKLRDRFGKFIPEP